MESVDQSTDQMEWLTWLYDRAASDDELSVMHPCDFHAPFPDDQAPEMFYKMLAITQPDLAVVGSDFGDLYLTTSFDTDPDLAATYDDELNCYEYFWNEHIRRIKQASPDTKLVFIWGNHERRLLRKLMGDASQFRKRIMADFIAIIRANGHVWYNGGIDHIRMGPLQVEHGNRHNDHLTKSRLIDEGAQVSLMMGHVHKRNFYEIRGADFTVASISSGCLCRPDPHYAQAGTSSRSGRKWTMGTAVASLRERLVEFENESKSQPSNHPLDAEH